MHNSTITIAYGDGIGPEIMEAVLYILKEAKVPLTVKSIEVGAKIYKKHYSSGITEDAWSSLTDACILLKAPITTPQGGGYKSLNVTLRKTLGLYANVRPTVSYFPFISTMHPEMNLVVIRENEEDLYAGIEYRHTNDMYESVKLISQSGSERIIRFAFEYAVKNNRRKVTCFSKDNIMKFSDGIFHRVFDKVAKEYNQIESNHQIIDIGSARLAKCPSDFDIIVAPNLYGDIISDIASEISGSVGMAGSANIGANYAMFEAVHGSAPDIAGKNIANPSGLLNAAIMMLTYMGLDDKAAEIENALKKTIEDGIHTADIYNHNISRRKVGTKEFAKAIVANLGQKPQKLKQAEYRISNNNNKKIVNATNICDNITINKKIKKELVGVDIFLQANIVAIDQLGRLIEKVNSLELDSIVLSTVSAKGLKLWPNSIILAEILSDHWCFRFMRKDKNKIMIFEQIIDLLKKLVAISVEVIKVENLYLFDGVAGFSLAQGE